jgi:hypothetical protein
VAKDSSRIVARWTTHVLMCLEGYPCEGRPAFVREQTQEALGVQFRGQPLPKDQSPCGDDEIAKE